MAPVGLLWVLSEPGELVKEEEFHDWYDNEHVPLRMSRIPEFLTGARYQAIDGQKPSWCAIYEVSSTDLFSHEKYTSLRSNRSPREAEVVSKLETLDRRTCEGIFDTASAPSKEAAPFLLTVGMTPAEGKEADFQDWYAKEHIDMMKKIPGCIRIHRYQVIDSLKTGAGKDPVQNGSPKFVAVYEFDNNNYPKTPEFEAGTGTAWSKSVMGSAVALDIRLWKLYRSWPNTAPKA